MPTRRRFLQTTAGCLIAGASTPVAARLRPSLSLTLSPEAAERPYTGRVYAFLSREHREPRMAADWFTPEPVLARDVVNLRPGDEVSLDLADPEVLRFPEDLKSIEGWRVQGVVRLSDWEREVGTGPGNACSSVLDADGGGRLVVDRLIPPRPVRESQWSRVFEATSELLSRFHQRPVKIAARITLPASYGEGNRTYPTIYEIPGFGGTIHHGYRDRPVEENNARQVEFLRVLLDPSCPLGHHVFADSDNNGPWGRALVEEFIPAFESEFRAIAEPQARLLTGHSSGGWSSLWTQITRPETFGGVWSTAPDPVDFHDFQRIDLYAPGENMFRDREGRRRPIARRGDRPILWYDSFCRMEDVLGHGGQLHSFEAVFSPRGENGRPQLLWDRETGEIDGDVAAAWAPYDIGRKLEREWERLAPQLAGRLNVFMGSEDTFYLEGAVKRLKQTLARLGSDAVVEIHEGRDHGSLMTRELVARIRAEMTAAFLRA